MTDTSGESSAQRMFQHLGQAMAMAHENSLRIGTLETRMAGNDERLIALIQTIPAEIRRFGFIHAVIGGVIGGFVGLMIGVLLIQKLLGHG